MDYIDAMGAGIFTYDATIFESEWNAIENVATDYLTKSG
jgi:hypothetical protein